MPNPRVVDTSHHNTVDDLRATAAAGVWGIIHKATQGPGYTDPDYVKRRAMAEDAGLLWGGYHFNDGSDVTAQVNHFLQVVGVDDTTLYVLDFEDNPKSNMTIQNMVKFLRLMEARTGRKCTIYSGNRLKENIHLLFAADRAYVCQHKLWLCQYGPMPKLPLGFARTFLWQFTDGQYGPQPHSIAGISGTGIDLNAFNGTREELTALWSNGSPVSSPLATPIADDAQQSAHAADAAQDADTSDSAAPPAPARNVRPQNARYDVGTEVVQRELDGMGYHEVGDIDGRWGGKTAGAIKAFYNDRGVTGVAELGPELNDEIGRAKSEGFTRPIADSRANAKPKDIAPHVEAVRVSLWQRLCAKVAAGAAAVGIGGSSVSDIYSSAQGTLSPVHDALARIPPEAWLLLVGAIAALVWYATNRAANAVTRDYNTGRLN